MADNSGDFKRNSNRDSNQDGEDASNNMNEKAGEYMRELLAEKIKLTNSKFPISCRLIDTEVAKVQSLGRVPPKESKYVDVMHEKPIKVAIKVIVPVKEFPKFNFVGQLLGPKGNTLKQLQEDTMCKMAVLGRGSMRSKEKEEELRNSLDPKYSHLTDELHVEISARAPPAEAHARIAYALAEIKKFLVPPPQGDMMGPNPLMERGPPPPMPHARGRMPPPRPMPPPRQMPPARPMQPSRPMQPKNKVFSILDRARSAMETSSYNNYDEPYAPEPPQIRPTRAAPEQDYYYENSGNNDRFYEDDYYKEEPQREYKASARDVGTRRQNSGPQRHFNQRPTPYSRQAK
ncbi:KH domain-containing, RNA-binding, signal transduction-associated protein 2-like isoform X2 [Leptidea sinapis]|uniref:KH domain-containing, RNA-binding, signal transduction-associated protein 2-like isoform X2 n=1 Tax=Leptidea sinapis TaxID=189913 RepID=UPI002120EDE7|nr:KH domain-containing, RNA-binding, signal transduction-associated protein 2-like isoform X2 [Leptidea sinapis]